MCESWKLKNCLQFNRRGNEFLKPLIILDQSILRGGDNAKKIADYVKGGENVVILSNHQTEADPQVSESALYTVYLLNTKCRHMGHSARLLARPYYLLLCR